MPNVLAHTLVAKRFFLKEDTAGNGSFLRGNYDFLSLGALGPDPLFVVGIIPTNGLHLFTAKKKLANRLHQTDGKKFFRLLTEQSYVIEDDYDRMRFQSFILGQLAHYLLDREAHPYILYESGFDENGKITGRYHYRHTYFETNIDYCLAKKNKMEYFLQNPSDKICSSEDFLKIIDDNLGSVLKRMFDLKHLPKRFYTNAVKNFKGVIRFENKNSERKAKLFGGSRLGSMILPVKGPDFPKCLNETKEVWLDPVTGEKHNDSFSEIQDRAYQILEDCYHSIQKNGFTYEVLSKYLNGLDYYGLPLGKRWVYKKD